jgi:hypothetical protein
MSKSPGRAPRAKSQEHGLSVWLLGLGVLALLVLAFWLWNRKTYPEATSPDGLMLIRAVYTACSSRNEERLSRVEQRLATAHADGQLTSDERAAFDAIIHQARSGDWQGATRESYAFAEDQVR